MKEKIFKPEYTKKQLTNEVERELRMRLGFWKCSDRKNERFIKPQHQQQYDLMKAVKVLLHGMSDRQYLSIQKKIEAQRQAVKAQQKMF